MRIWQRVLMGLMIACLVSGFSVVSPNVSVEAAAAPTYDQAVGLLRLYFKDLNGKNYQAAYHLRGASLQRRQSYSSFSAGFSRTSQNDLKVVSTTAVGTTTVVRCELDATLMSGGQQAFRGSYTIGRENGHFRIVSANLTVVA